MAKKKPNYKQSMGDILNPMSAPQPGDPSTKLYSNED